MRLAYATSIFMFWLIASLYWNHSLRVCPPSLHALHRRSCIVEIKTSNSEQINKPLAYIRCLEYGMLDKCLKQHIFPLITSPLQAPLIDKWNGEMYREKRRNSIATKNNISIWYLCRMAYSRSLDKSFDGVRDMETSQNKKRTSSTACLTVLETNKKKNASKKNTHLWLGFKALNALNASKGLEEIAHKSVSELVKFGMSEKEALECQNCVPSYPHVPQEM